MKRSQGGPITTDPTQPAAPPAAFTDRSAFPATPAITPTPLHGPTAHAPAGAAAYDIHRPRKDQQHRGIRAELSHLAGLTKHASDAGLAGVAEAAGHLLGELTPASRWRQEVLQIRMTAGVALSLMLGYALLLAPRKLGFWGEAALVVRGCSDNALSFVLFNMLGIMPALLGCVAWPLLRNKHYKARPLRPYLVASFGTGAFAFLSYITRWDPPKKPNALPPARLAGRTAWLQRLSESRVLPATLLASTLWLYSVMAVATPATWAHFGYLFSHSMTVHVMLIDFAMLTLLSSWLVVRDASARGWGLVNTPAGRWILGLAVVLAPAVGPGVYLMIRPVAADGYGVRSLCKDAAALLLLPAQWVRGFLQRHGGSSRALRRSAEIHVGSSAAAAADRAAQVAAAAAVPLPSSLRLAARAVEGIVSDSWHRGWLWVGQRVARLRGGGAGGASTDDAAGAELDVAAGRDVEVPAGEAGHSSGITGHTPAQRPWNFWQQQQQSPLGPGPSPVKARVPDGGVELLFTDDYDEYDADISETSSDVTDDVSDILTDSDDDTEIDDSEGELAVQPKGAGVHYEDEPLDEDDPEVQDEEEDELFDVVPRGDQGLANGGGSAAAGGSSGSHGSGPAKEAALRKLAELGVQKHHKLATSVFAGSSMY